MADLALGRLAIARGPALRVEISFAGTPLTGLERFLPCMSFGGIPGSVKTFPFGPTRHACPYLSSPNA